MGEVLETGCGWRGQISENKGDDEETMVQGFVNPVILVRQAKPG